MRQPLTKSLVLAGAGTLLGLVFAASATRLLIGMLPEDAGSWPSAAVDVRVVGFAGALALVTAIGFGLGPALRATGSRAAALRPGTGRVLGGGKQTGLLRVLVVGQVALSLLLVAGAGLFARSLYNLRWIDPGFITDRLLQLRVDAALNGYDGPQALVLAGRLRQELMAIAGVTAVSAATVPAMMNGFGFQTVRVQGYDPTTGEEMNSMINSVGPGYVATLGVPLLQGRDFTDSDVEGGQRVAIVNEAMANRWKGENPIGRRFGRQSETGAEIEVVGVVRDSRFANLRDDVRMSYYIPLAQSGPLDRFTFYVRHRAADAAIAPALRQAVARVDPRLPIYDFRTMESQIAESINRTPGVIAVGLVRTGGVGSGCRRALRGDVARGCAAAPRDRHPDGARRRAELGALAGASAGARAGRCGRADRSAGGARCGTADRVAPVRAGAEGSGDDRRRGHCADRRGDVGGLCAGDAGDAR